MADPEETPPDPNAEILAALNELGYTGVTGAHGRDHALAELMTKDWGELEVLEHADHLLFPEKLIRRKADGGWDETDIMLRVPRDPDMRQARVEARAWAASAGIDEKRDRDLFETMENMCILAASIRNSSAPYEPWEPDPKILEKRYDKVCLRRLWERLDKLNDILNPNPDQLSAPEIVALIIAIAKARHLGPLVVYGPGAQTSFVVSMVDLLLSSLGSKLSSESLGRLMRES